MITVDEARELVNTATIPFPQDWKEQMLRIAEEAIQNTARSGKKLTNLKGIVYSVSPGGYNRGTFYLSAEQLSEIAAVLKQNGFGVGEDYRIRFDGQPLTIDILW